MRGMKNRLRELAGMIKRKKKGTMKELIEIRAKFCLQEGLKVERSEEYLSLLEDAGLITFLQGHKLWKYHPEREWELFNINV